MRYEDAITVATPEGIDLELILAGLGSRFIAALVDLVLKGLILAALAVLFVFQPVSGGFGAALYSVLGFLVFFGYYIAFETLASGRTPGKRWNGLRVVRLEGQPVGFLAATIRNVLRLVDILPFGYAIGCLSILVSARNQRLGDIVGGTLVIRERPGSSSLRRAPWPPAPARDGVEAWDVSAVTTEELAAVHRFLERRYDLEPETRAELGAMLAERLRPKVVAGSGDLHVEAFLEGLAAAKAARR